MADALDLFDAMRNEEHGYIVVGDEFLDTPFAFLLEEKITHGKRFIDDEDVRDHDCGD